MHQLHQLIRKVNRTHKGLGQLVAINLLAAKAKKCILNISPAGCGKSTATDIVYHMLRDRTMRFTSMTLAGLKNISGELTGFGGHIIIDDLGAEKTQWSRTATVTVLANLVHTGYVYKITQGYTLEITNFQGSAAINIQPVLMQQQVVEADWVAVVRDKVLRYYHLIRPKKPKHALPAVSIDWGASIDNVQLRMYRGRLWYQLVAIGLTQWSYARCEEHLPDLLKAAAALDGRSKVNRTDYNLLIKMLKPMVLERYLIKSYGFEAGRTFQNDLFCILVEIASHGEPTVDVICEDYKINPETVIRVAKENPVWVKLVEDKPMRVIPTDTCKHILKIAGVNQKW